MDEQEGEKMNAAKPNISKDDVFKYLVEGAVTVNAWGINITPATAMAEHFGVSRYRIRKCLEPLIADGLVKSYCESGYDTYDERYYIVRGFGLTEKGRDTPEYKEAYEKEMKYINDMIHRTEG